MLNGSGGRHARHAYRLLSGLAIGLLLLAMGAPATAQTQPSTRESRFSRGAEAEIVFQEGVLRYTNKQLPDAEAAFRKVIQADPDDADAYYYLGLSQVDQGKADEALASFDQSLRLDPTRLEARAARATAAIRAQKYDVAKEDLDRLATDPRWTSLVHYLRGQLAYQSGELDAASREFGAARASGSTEAEPARFYETLTYLRMKQMVQAREAFAETTIDPQRDPTIGEINRQLARRFEGAPASGAAPAAAAPSKLTGEFDLSYVYDSNVVQLGQNVQLPGSISNQPDSRIVVQPSATYNLITSDNFTLGIQASGYFAFQFDLNNFDIASYQIGPYATYRLSENVYVGLSYAFNYIELEHDAYLNRNIVTPIITINEPSLSHFGPNSTQVYYQLEMRQFADEFATTAERDALDRDGQLHTLGVIQRISLPEIFKGEGNTSLKVDYRLFDQETRGSDYDALGNLVGVTFYTPLPFWKLKADAGVSYELDDYRHANSLDAGHDERFDQILNVSVGLTKELFKNCSFRVDYTYTHDDSNVSFTGTADHNVEVFDYDRHQLGVRLQYTF